jgi:hypothetical protein
MAEAVVSAPVADIPKGPGLLARLVGVIFSPRATYAAVVARPRVLGAFIVTVGIMAVTEGVFFSTQVMQEVLLDQQVKMMESFGVNISDQMYAGLEAGIGRAAYTTPISLVILIPIVAALVAVLVLGIWGMLMGGTGTFKQVYAIVAHSGVITALQVLFAMPLSYATRRLAGATLSVFVPMLEETTFLARFLGAIDLFWIWWCVSLAIGIGVLFKRKTGGIAMTLISFYVVVALILALVRSGN